MVGAEETGAQGGGKTAAPVPPNASPHEKKTDEQAWALGCSEADCASHVLPAGDSPTVWWADVETGNSWSTNTTLNDFALDGMSWYVTSPGNPKTRPFGVYG